MKMPTLQKRPFRGLCRQTEKCDKIHTLLLRFVSGCASMWRCLGITGNLKSRAWAKGRKCYFNISVVMSRISRRQMVGGTVDPGDVLPSGVRSYGSRKVGEKKNVAMSQRTQWQGQRESSSQRRHQS